MYIFRSLRSGLQPTLKMVATPTVVSYMFGWVMHALRTSLGIVSDRSKRALSLSSCLYWRHVFIGCGNCVTPELDMRHAAYVVPHDSDTLVTFSGRLASRQRPSPTAAALST